MASPRRAESPAASTTAGLATAIGLDHETGDHDAEHSSVEHLGAICFWLVIGGAALLATAELGHRISRRHRATDRTGAPCRPSSALTLFGRAPPRTLAVQLLC